MIFPRLFFHVLSIDTMTGTFKHALVIIQQSVLHNNTRAYICVCTTMSAARCSHSIGCEQGIDLKDYLKDDGQKLFLQENKVKNKIWNLVLVSTDKGSIVCLR